MIEPTCVAELYADPNFQAMVKEYSEYASKTMPAPQFNQADYQGQENHGLLNCWRVTRDGLLVGFMSIITARSLHFGPGLAIVESLFVMRAYRKSTAGVELVRMAKLYAKNRDFKVLVVQCPYGATLAKLLEKENFTPEIICYCFNP